MHRTVEHPLGVYFSFPSKGKSVQSYCGANIPKYRFCRSESPVVDESASDRIDLAFHLLGERLRLPLRTPLKEVHLSGFRPVRMSQASLP